MSGRLMEVPWAVQVRHEVRSERPSEFRSAMCRTRPKLVELGPMTVERGADSADSGPSSFGRVCALKLGRLWAEQLWPLPVRLAQLQADVGPSVAPELDGIRRSVGPVSASARRLRQGRARSEAHPPEEGAPGADPKASPRSAVGAAAAELGLPGVSAEDGGQEGAVLAVRAETLEDVLSCRSEARRVGRRILGVARSLVGGSGSRCASHPMCCMDMW